MASETRGQITQKSQNATRDATITESYLKTSYANSLLPKKDQAIVLDSIEGSTIDDYIDGMEKITDAANITHISKISGNRVCIYLNSKTLVESLSENLVEVNKTLLKIRPLKERNTRVVISNVSPSMSNDIILLQLQKLGINPVSQVHSIRAGLIKPGRSHILSFRRQVYIKEEETRLIPESLQIVFDNTPSWIYFSTDSTSCYVCKQKGHIAKLCPNVPIYSQNLHDTQKETEVALEDINVNTKEQEPIKKAENKGLKRQAPSSSTSKSLEINEIYMEGKNFDQNTIAHELTNLSKVKETKFKKPSTNKKTKIKDKSSSEENISDKDIEIMTDALKVAKNALESASTVFPINFHQLQTFLEKSYGKTNITDILLQFTSDVNGVIKMLDVIYPLVDSNNLKARIARIKKKLTKYLIYENTDIDSENSQSS